MVLKRQVLLWDFEEYWYDESAYLHSFADIVALRTHSRLNNYHLRIPEFTLIISLKKSVEEIAKKFTSTLRNNIKQANKQFQIQKIVSDKDRAAFYDAYIPFAKTRKLLVPNPEEESDLEIYTAMDAEGELVQASAFLPIPSMGIYRYRYGVSLKKSLTNKAILYQALLDAKAQGFKIFDFGGIEKFAKEGSKEAGINQFKLAFGGEELETHLYLKGNTLISKFVLQGCEKLGLGKRLQKLSSLCAYWARK